MRACGREEESAEHGNDYLSAINHAPARRERERRALPFLFYLRSYTFILLDACGAPAQASAARLRFSTPPEAQV